MSERKFKVVDRRRFTEDGDERHSDDIREEAPPTKAPAERAPEAHADAQMPEAPQEQTPTADSVAEGGLTFDIFIQSLAQQAMMQLGLIPWSHTGERALQIEQARDTIDVMDLLEKKTRGNLSDKEKNLLTSVLYELRMSYMEINQQLAQAALQQKPPGA